jgi:hypothetical protein
VVILELEVMEDKELEEEEVREVPEEEVTEVDLALLPALEEE